VRPRIAIPVPLSRDPEYVERSLPQYERAVELAGGEPVRIPLDRSPAELGELIETCRGVLLPGSGADIDPAEYKAQLSPKTHPADPKRHAVDWALLEDAFRQRKPVLGICYGLQSLNVYCRGSLIQHIESPVNHAVGRKAAIAHDVEIDSNSLLAKLVKHSNRQASGSGQCLAIPVNSSHHQSAEVVGEGLRIVARCPQDGIIEALEGTAPEHFVMAVQWHPERSVDADEPSRAIFKGFVEAVKERVDKFQASSKC
jgi:putative glutamine amidotransferase